MIRIFTTFRLWIFNFALVFYFSVPGIIQSQTDFSSNLPIAVIDTQGKKIRDNTRITAHLGIVNNGPLMENRFGDPYNDYDGWIAIEIRGSSGQWKNWPKIHYGFETQDDQGNNNNVSLAGLPKENDWILNPPYSDKSLMRNALAYRLARATGRYAPRTRFCEVFVNGDYRGVYVLTEKIKRDNNRIDIATLKPEDIEGDQLTGGYVIKIDRSAGEENEGWMSPYKISPESDRVVPWLYHDPGPDELKPVQMEYIKNYVLSFEKLMNQRGWQSTFADYFDVEAFVDYFLVNELAKNVDVYTFSTYFYKDRDSHGGRLTIGPVWDFNLGFGNVNYFEGEKTTGWLLGRKIAVHDRIPFWLENLFQSSDIQNKIRTRWHELKQAELSLQNIHQIIEEWAELLDEAQQRNFQRWPILGEYIWPNYYIGDTFTDEIQYLKSWIRDRWQWMDDQLTTDTGIDNRDKQDKNDVNLYPNPSNSSTTFSLTMKQPAVLRLTLYNLTGQLIMHKILGEVPSGAQSFTIDTQGLTSGTYFYQISSSEWQYTGTMTIIQ